MAIPVRSLAVLAGVSLGAGLFMASGLSRTAGVVTEAVTSAPSPPSAAGPSTPNYIVRLPVAKARPSAVTKSVPARHMSTPVTSASVVPVAPPPAAAELTVTTKPTFSHQVVASGANVRTGPKKSFPQVFTLHQGNWVNVSDNVRGWVKVTDETGREGWVFGSLLRPASPGGQAVVTAE